VAGSIGLQAQEYSSQHCWKGLRKVYTAGMYSVRINSVELTWVNIFEMELISVNFGESYFSKGWSLFQ
jgi:hypothetical protein